MCTTPNPEELLLMICGWAARGSDHGAQANNISGRQVSRNMVSLENA